MMRCRGKWDGDRSAVPYTIQRLGSGLGVPIKKEEKRDQQERFFGGKGDRLVILQESKVPSGRVEGKGASIIDQRDGACDYEENRTTLQKSARRMVPGH